MTNVETNDDRKRSSVNNSLFDDIVIHIQVFSSTQNCLEKKLFFNFYYPEH